MNEENLTNESIDESTLQSAKAPNKKAIYIISVVSAILLLVAAYFVFLFSKQRFITETYELGDQLSTDSSHYSYGTALALKKADLNLKSVDNMTVGTYKATLTIRKKTYTYEIVIVDTTAPVINALSPEINIGIDYNEHSFYKDATDLSGPVSTKFYIDAKETTEFSLAALGKHEAKIVATDINGNTSEKVIAFDAVDTLAPIITPLDEYGYYATNRTYDAYSFVNDITDNSKNFTLVTKVDGTETDTIEFAECSNYEINITATDALGNSSSFTVNVDTDDAPIIYGYPIDLSANVLVPSGIDARLLDDLIAWDNEEGFISNRICYQVDYNSSGDGMFENIDLSSNGTSYQITYTVADEHNLETSVSIKYETVAPRNVKRCERYYPDELIEKMIAEDYFDYELLSEPDLPCVQTLVWPCEVAFDFERVLGSGFIYSIEPDYVYIATAGHCVSKSDKINDFSITFYNPTNETHALNKSYQYKLDHISAESVREYSNMEDQAMIRVERSLIPNEFLIHLKQINRTNEDTPRYDNGIHAYAMYVARGALHNRFMRDFTPFTGYGNSVYEEMLDHFPSYRNSEKWLLTKETSVSGQSGSVLFDDFGNPIAITSGSISYRYNGSYYSFGRMRKINCLKPLYDKLKENDTPKEETSEAAKETVATE